MLSFASSAVMRSLMLLASAALPLSCGTAHSQEKYPSRPVRVIVPFPPGGNTDVIARMIGQRLAEEYGQQFVVDNRGGAGGTLGAEIAQRANPDGYTIIVVASTYASSAAVYKLPYDAAKEPAPSTPDEFRRFIGEEIAKWSKVVKAGNIKVE